MRDKIQYLLEQELFKVPYKEDFIIYAPLKNVLFLANAGLIQLLYSIKEGIPIDVKLHKDTIDKLKQLGLIHETPIISPIPASDDSRFDKPFLPLNLTLFLTSECNLACRYCYAGGGEDKYRMSMNIARDAIDLLFLNAAKLRAKHVHLGFHGGGEPTVRFKQLKDLVDYAQQLSRNREISLSLGLTTNGVLSTEVAHWVAQHIDQLNISLDGFEDIQNLQRPTKKLGNSYQNVSNTLKIMDANEKTYSIRSTITEFSENKILDIVHHFINYFRPKEIHLEPMFVSSRAAKESLKIPNDKIFTNGFILAARMAKKKEVKLHFSGFRFPEKSKTFCGIGWKNFAVTPQGNVTACFEVLHENDPRSDIFFYGRYVPNKGFSFDKDKIINLRRLSEGEKNFCKDCFAKYQCAGDCLAKGLYHCDISNFRGGRRCNIIRSLTRMKMIEMLNLPQEGDSDG